MPEYRHLEVEQAGDVTTVRLKPDTNHAEDFEEIAGELSSLVAEGQHKKLLLDLGNVDYLQSTGIGKLVSVERKLHDAGGTLRLCGLKPPLQELFEITGLDDVFDIYPTEDAGLKEF